MNLKLPLLKWLRLHLPYVNIALAALAFLANTFVIQVFCQPVPWAALCLVSSLSAFLVWPWLDRLASGWRYLSLFLQGVFLVVCVYCAWFIGWGLLLVVLLVSFLLLPALAWLPVFFAAQVLKRVFTSPLPGAKVAFGAGVLAMGVIQAVIEGQYRTIEAAIARLPMSARREPGALARVVPRSYTAERLAGTLFKYHNYIETYDGWRPPLHDPWVNVSLWLRGGQQFDKAGVREVNPLLVPDQVGLYHRLFPNLPLKAACVCAYTHDGLQYQQWVPAKPKSNEP